MQTRQQVEISEANSRCAEQDMPSVDEYCDAARQLHNLKTDAQLAKMLGISPSNISQWRTKRTWPSDQTMLELATLAGVGKEKALLDLNMWRSAGSPAYDVYEKIVGALKKAAVLVLVMSVVTISISSETKAARISTPINDRMLMCFSFAAEAGVPSARFLPNIFARPAGTALPRIG